VKVQFEFSTADLAEVANRTVNRSPLMHRWRRGNAAASAVLAGLVAFARDRAFPEPQVRADFVSLARSHIPVDALPEDALKRMPERPFANRPTEGEYFVAWLLFFVCVSVTGNLASTAIGSGAAAILRMPGTAPAHGVYVFAGLSFIATASLSYVFFRFFAKRLVSQVRARLTVNAA
jgi:hypothetical protein